MRKPFSPPPRVMLAALSISMLTACASSPGTFQAQTPPTSAVTVTKVETRTICPAELDQPLPAKPSPAADSHIQANASGSAYIGAMLDWSAAVSKLFTDAAAACQTEKVAPE